LINHVSLYLVLVLRRMGNLLISSAWYSSASKIFDLLR